MEIIANAIDEFQEYSFQYNVKIVGVPEVCSDDEAASTTSRLCVKLFKEMFFRFYKCVNKTINKHAPLRSISNRKQKFLAKPWLTAGLRKSIRVKNNLFYTSDRDKYKFYRNKIISLTRLSKANYLTKVTYVI